MTGAPDPLYVAARQALLDALQAIHPHLDAVILVGAQAVYLRTGAGQMAVAPYTTDADLALDPAALGSDPLLEDLLELVGFSKDAHAVGAWEKQVQVDGVPRRMVVDILVPAAVGGPGRRGARIPPHDRRAARKVSGLEGALVDRRKLRIGALDPSDARAYDVHVAGPAALIVAKVVKIAERVGAPRRQYDKDALDILRLLQAVPTQLLATRLKFLGEHPLSGAPTEAALRQLAELFSTRTAPGSRMAARAAAPLEDEDTIAGSIAILVQDLLAAMSTTSTSEGD